MATMRLRLRELVVVLGCTGLLVSACGGETANSEECLPGDFEAVTLADGGGAFLRCTIEGGAYLPYGGPDPNVPHDAGSAPDAAACGANGAPLGYFCGGCSASAPCAPGLDCVPFPNKGGNLCTPACTPATASSLCVAPSEGCGMNGHCKPGS
jgi:hypothetical protein